VPRDRAGILVDEEFGADILRDAVAANYVVALPVEKSGQHEFDFEYGEAFAEHIERFSPTFVKVLVRFNPAADAEMNDRQLERLKRVSDYCRQSQRRLMFELLVPPEASQLERVKGDRTAYDLDLRPGLMVESIERIQEAGVEPDVWKIEGLDRAADCEKIVTAARRPGPGGSSRARVGCIVLGRGENEAKVLEWLGVAATVPGFIGFAVGRSSFLQPIVDLRAGKIDEDKASAQIAHKYLEWVDTFDRQQRAMR
jgi:myo-inositol catabolism protein IolC